MDANKFEYTDSDEFMKKYDELRATGDMFLVYLTGGVDPTTNVSWCPDCDAARPSIQTNCLDKIQIPVVKGVVLEKNTWVGVATHPYKKHPILKAGGVPSLLLCQGDQVLMRADDEEHFKNDDFVASFTGEE